METSHAGYTVKQLCLDTEIARKIKAICLSQGLSEHRFIVDAIKKAIDVLPD